MTVAIAVDERTRVRTRDAVCASCPPFSHVPRVVTKLRQPHPTLVSLNRASFGEESWGWQDVCFSVCFPCYLSPDWATLLWLFPCASTLAGLGGATTRFSGLSVFWFLFWLAKRLISYFPLPDTTIHLASQHISDTEHSIGGPRLAGWNLLGGVPWDGTAAGRQGALLFLVGWEGKDCA
jgi:hypothetical protein